MFLIFHILTGVFSLVVGSMVYEIIKTASIRREVSLRATVYVVLFTVLCLALGQYIAYDLNTSRGIIYGWQSILGSGR